MRAGEESFSWRRTRCLAWMEGQRRSPTSPQSAPRQSFNRTLQSDRQAVPVAERHPVVRNRPQPRDLRLLKPIVNLRQGFGDSSRPSLRAPRCAVEHTYHYGAHAAHKPTETRRPLFRCASRGYWRSRLSHRRRLPTPTRYWRKTWLSGSAGPYTPEGQPRGPSSSALRVDPWT